MPADLIDAVIAHLEGDQAVRSAFGDTWDQATGVGVPKFFSDLVAQVDAPWCLHIARNDAVLDPCG